MKDYQKEFQKIQAKHQKKLYKKLKVTAATSQDEINQKVLNYVQEGGEIYAIHLSPEQQADASFMLDLYKADPALLGYFTISKELQNNFGFMIDYFKLHFARDLGSATRLNFSSDDILINIVKNYQDLVQSPLFLLKFNQSFPKCNLPELIYASLSNSLRRNMNSDSFALFVNNSDIDLGEREIKYKAIIEKLPAALLLSQAQLLGSKALKIIPVKHPQFAEFVAAGVSVDGFKSLELLHKKDVPQNLELILKAFEHDGKKEFVNYFKKALSPQRTEYYMCHGELHSYTYFDKDYLAIQKSLVKNKEFWGKINLPAEEKTQLQKLLQTEIDYNIAYERRESVRREAEKSELVANNERSQNIDSELLEKNFSDDDC